MQGFDLEQLNDFCKNSLIEHLGIEFTQISKDLVAATMPVDKRTKQPFGLLHGGATVVLAETVASAGAILNINLETHTCVGLEINANHIKSVAEGLITGIAKPLHLGYRTQVWQIEVLDNTKKKLIAICRMTALISERK